MNADAEPPRRHEVSEAAGPPSELVRHLASGEAALTLLECVLLRMLERGLLNTEELVDAVETAIATKRQMAADGDHTQVATVAAGTLRVIANSFSAAEITREQWK